MDKKLISFLVVACFHIDDSFDCEFESVFHKIDQDLFEADLVTN